MQIQKLLISNRGEIAIRVARTCRKLGIKTVAIYSEQDHASQHVEFCDEAYSLGEGTIAETYLDIKKICTIVKRSGAAAVHPGYGFLSERASFAKAIEDCGAKFVGPSVKSIDAMGDKLRARSLMKKMGVPLLPATLAGVQDIRTAKKACQSMGFPVLLKASAGGGGKGMRIMRSASELESGLEAAAREAKNYFGDNTIYIEKYLENPHHVEVQVLGDGKGGGGHVFDRECSIQRRHQKLLEESPAPVFSRFPKSKAKILRIANDVVKRMKYASAGTLEFLADDEGQFYFLEMNTRLQVEHPVTEWVTGVDLVEKQIEVAQGLRLKSGPLVSEQRGHSIEVRIYAETPFEHLPTGGQIECLQLPTGAFVRIDSAVYPGYEILTDYDPTLMKLSVWADNRLRAVDTLRTAIDELRILGCESNQGLFYSICREDNFRKGQYGTAYLSLRQKELRKIYDNEMQRLLPLFSIAAVEVERQPRVAAVESSKPSAWEQVSRRMQIRGEA